MSIELWKKGEYKMPSETVVATIWQLQFDSEWWYKNGVCGGCNCNIRKCFELSWTWNHLSNIILFLLHIFWIVSHIIFEWKWLTFYWIWKLRIFFVSPFSVMIIWFCGRLKTNVERNRLTCYSFLFYDLLPICG